MFRQRAGSSSSQPLPGIALIGNPGTGKSTILNGLVGNARFRSGESYGPGLTQSLDEYEHNDRLYFDTPGLSDIKRRKEAGEAIDELLKRKIPLKIAFVVAAMGGRVRPEDAVTVGLVLDAIKSVDTNNKFGIIINQMSSEFIEKMNNDPLTEQTVKKSITGSRDTSHWCYVEFNPEIYFKSDKQLLTKELESFFRSLPETKPKEAETMKINTATFQETMAKMEAEFNEREELLKKELETHELRVKTLETLTIELQTMLKDTRESNKERIDQFKEQIEHLKEEMAKTNLQNVKPREIRRALDRAQKRQVQARIEENLAIYLARNPNFSARDIELINKRRKQLRDFQ